MPADMLPVADPRRCQVTASEVGVGKKWDRMSRFHASEVGVGKKWDRMSQFHARGWLCKMAKLTKSRLIQVCVVEVKNLDCRSERIDNQLAR